MGNSTKRLKIIFIALCTIATHRARAIDFNADLFRQGLEHSLESPRNFAGRSTQNFVGPKGPNCDYRSRLKLAWNADVQKVNVELDNHGNTAVALVLANSQLGVEGLGREGWLCRWAGGRGKVGMGTISINFKLLPTSHEHTPDVSFDGLTFSDIHFTDFSVGMPGLGWIGGEVPHWIESWVESNLNGVIQGFLSSELKTRLDAYLSRELAKKLEDYIKAPQTPPDLSAITID